MPADVAFPPPIGRGRFRVRAVLRALGWLALGGAALLALALAGLHLWVVPRIDEWRPWIERQASQATGLQVQIGRLQARRNGLLPDLVAQDGQVRDADGRLALDWQRLEAGLSVRALLRGGVEALRLQAPQIHVALPVNGDLAGRAGDASDAGDQSDGRGQLADLRAWQWLVAQPEVRIEQGRLQVEQAGHAARMRLEDVALSWQRHALLRRHRVDLAFAIADGGGEVSLQASLRGLDEPSRDGRPWPALDGSARLRLVHVDMQAIAGLPAVGVRGRADADATLRLDHGNLQSLQWMLHADAPQWQPAGAPPAVAWDRLESAGLLTAEPQAQSVRWQLSQAHVGVQRGDQAWHSGAVSGHVAWAPAAAAGRAPRLHEASVQIGQLDLGTLGHLLPFDAATLAPAGAPGASALEPANPGAPEVVALPARWAHWWDEWQRWQPAGEVRDVAVAWQRADGDAAPWFEGNWSIAAELLHVTLGMQAGAGRPAPPLGVQALSGAIQGDARSGAAALRIDAGALRLPTVFEQAEIPVDHLRADVQWALDAEGGIELRLQAPELANAHATGHADLVWRTSTDAEIAQLPLRRGRLATRLPGHLDLSATLTQADATQVARYLPLAVDEEVRRYVREAVQQGRGSDVRFEVRGSLQRFPFDARQSFAYPESADNAAVAGAGVAVPAQDTAAATAPLADEVFRISAAIHGVDYRYAPHYLLPAREQGLVWPDLAGVEGRLLFEGNRMVIDVAGGHLQKAPAIAIAQGQAVIDDFTAASVAVDVRARGPLQPQLDVLQTTPVARMTDRLLDTLSGDGAAGFRLQLAIPLGKQADGERDTRVQGEIQLQGNNLAWLPQVPALQDVHGQVRFTEKGFELDGVTAQALGGPVRLRVAMQEHAAGQPVRAQVQAEGRFTAEGLQRYAEQALDNAMVAALAQGLAGQADYRLEVETIGARPYVLLESDMQGLQSRLPAPLEKSSDAPRPLRVRLAPPDDAAQEVLEVQWGDRVYARYVLGPRQDDPLGHLVEQLQGPADARHSAAGDGAAAARPAGEGHWEVREGNILIGAFTEDERRLAGFIPHGFAAAPVDGRVRATIAWDEWDASQWLPWLQPDGAGAQPDADFTALNGAAVTPGSSFVPDVWYGRFGRLQWGALGYDDVQVQAYLGGAQRNIWVANVQADRARGTLEYHSDYLEGTGLLRGKIDYLELPAGIDQASAADAEAGRGNGNGDASLAERIRHLPTVDLEIEHLLFANRDWGRVALQAMNRVEDGTPSEWRINYLTMETPEARLTAKGSWQSADARGRWQPLLSGRKRMDMQFTLELFDGGRLLARMGRPDLLRGGAGVLDGRLSWLGSPLKLDVASLAGALQLDVRGGQFLPVDAGAGRLLGVLSLQALPRRLSLDFRDVFSEGFAFDFVRGDVQLKEGRASTNNLQMQGVNAGVVLDGHASLVEETQDIRVVVVPELDAMTAALVATAINPAVGAGTFLAQMFLAKPLAASAAREFHIHGTWSEPVVERVGRQAPPQPFDMPESGNAP